MTVYSNQDFDTIFADRPVMAILRGHTVARSVELAATAWDLGIDLVEVTVQGDRDLDALSSVAASAHERGKLVGAGTLLRPEQVDTVLRAGAAFAVSPGLHPEVATECAAQNLLLLPGAATATEVAAAQIMGFTWLKAFPASALGASWIASMAGPFPEISFVATGGIDATSASTFLAAGARVVGIGSSIANSGEPEKLGRILSR